MSYFQFDRRQWATLCTLPTMLTEKEIEVLKNINEDLSFKEVAEIYFPLSCLLNFFYCSNLQRQIAVKHIFNKKNQCIPLYIVGITGSVAVGKSTTARVLQLLLSRCSEYRQVELITTDGFLYSNQILKERNLMNKKGFPQSYDWRKFMELVSNLKSGISSVSVPIYSHFFYDIIPGMSKIIDKPDILILEGLNILQNRINHSHNSHRIFISDIIDFSIYIDASEELLRDWYISRFLKFRKMAFSNPNSYFYHYSQLTKKEAISMATSLWNEINYVNLKENILPTREYASLILTKSKNHSVKKIQLRK